MTARLSGDARNPSADAASTRECEFYCRNNELMQPPNGFICEWKSKDTQWKIWRLFFVFSELFF